MGAVAGPVAELVGPAIGKVASKVKQGAGDLYRSATGIGGDSASATLDKASGAMSNSILGNQRAMQGFAQEVSPDQNAMSAIRELGMENYTTPGMV